MNTRLVRQSPPVFVRVAVKIAVKRVTVLGPVPVESCTKNSHPIMRFPLPAVATWTTSGVAAPVPETRRGRLEAGPKVLPPPSDRVPSAP